MCIRDRASGAALGGEQSGHILSASHGLCGDGVLTAVQLATLCHAQGISLSDWLDRSFQAYPQKLVNVRVMDRARRKNWSACTALTDAIASAEQSDAVEHWTGHLAAVAEEQLNVA